MENKQENNKNVFDEERIELLKKTYPEWNIIPNKDKKYGTNKSPIVVLSEKDMSLSHRELCDKYNFNYTDKNVYRIKYRGYFRLLYLEREIEFDEKSMESLVTLSGGYTGLIKTIKFEILDSLKYSVDSVFLDKIIGESLLKCLESSGRCEGISKSNKYMVRAYVKYKTLQAIKDNFILLKNDFINIDENIIKGEIEDLNQNSETINKLYPILKHYVKLCLFLGEKDAKKALEKRFNIHLKKKDFDIMHDLCDNYGLWDSIEFIGRILKNIIERNPSAELIWTNGMSFYIKIDGKTLRVSDHNTNKRYDYDITPETYNNIQCPYLI